MEALFEGEELRSDRLSLAAQQAGISPRQLHRAFPRLCAGVGEKDAIEARALREAQGEFRLPFVKEEI